MQPARISANAQFALRGDLRGPIQFYWWVWHSGTYGGERLFHPHPDYCHDLFLRKEGNYLRTVADFPAYGVEIPCHGMGAIVSDLQSAADKQLDALERFVTAFLRTDLEFFTAIYRNDEPHAFDELVGLTSEFYVASQLDLFCRDLPNRVW